MLKLRADLKSNHLFPFFLIFKKYLLLYYTVFYLSIPSYLNLFNVKTPTNLIAQWVFFKKSNLFFNKHTRFFTNFLQINTHIESDSGDRGFKFLKQNFKKSVGTSNLLEVKNLSLDSTLDLKKSFYKSVIENRKLFKALILKKWIRANRLTKFILKLTNQTHKNRFYFINFRLGVIAKHSGFIFSEKDLTWLVKNKLIYLNRCVLANVHYTIYPSDLIELVFLKTYFQYLNKNRKFKYINPTLFKKKLIKIKKPGTKQFLKTISLFKERGGEIYPIGRFIEFDLQSLSFFVLPKFRELTLYYNLFKNRIPLYSFSFLNWKY